MASDDGGKVRIQQGDRSFVGDIGLQSKMPTRERSILCSPLDQSLRMPSGAAAMGFVATIVDVGTSDPALANCRPDWTATQDLELHGTGWLTEGPIVVDCHLIRLGKKVIIAGAEAYDGRGEDDLDRLIDAIDRRDPALARVAKGLVTFARIPGSAAADKDAYDPSKWVGQVRERATGHTVDGALVDEMGIHVVERGEDTAVAELARTRYVANSIGTINGGAQAMLVNAAAEATSPGFEATDLQIHYLSQVKVGPGRALATVDRVGTDHRVASVHLVDAGADDQLLALATVTLQRPPT